MRSIWRTEDQDLPRRVAAISAATLLIGASFGAIASASGIPPWLSVTMSVLVFAGGSQFAAVALVASGSGALVAALAGVLLSARHLPYGIAVGDVLGRRWPARLAGSHLMVDASVAFALAESDPRRRRVAYWTCGAALFLAWNTGVLVGTYAGNRLGDPAALGLDAAFPAALLALLLPSLTEPRARAVAAAGAAIALAATPLMPAGVSVLLALAALPVALLVRRRPARREPAPTPGGATS